MEYALRVEDIPILEKKLESLNKKFKANNVEISYRKLGTYFKEDSNGIVHQFVDLELEGYSKIGDYKIVAIIDHGENGNIVNIIEKDLVTNYEQLKKEGPVCEHCNINRFRKITIMLSNGKDIIRVGKSCLKEYLGIDAEKYAKWLQFLDGIRLLSTGGGKAQAETFLEVNKTLLFAIEETIKNGYLSKYTYTEDGERFFNKENTTDKVIDKYYKEQPDTKYQEEINKLTEWVNSQEDASELIESIKDILREGYVKTSNAGTIVCAYKIYQTALKRNAIDEIKMLSNYVGNIKDKIEFESNIICKATIETHYGYMHIYEMVLNNDIFIWKTGTGIREGKYKIKGTIKEHSEYNGIKQTILTRCKVESIDE